MLSANSKFVLLLFNQAEVAYQPYTPLCRGENASSSDLWKCYKALDVYDPLYRGLYADQLERWFRVFDRFQVRKILGDRGAWAKVRYTSDYNGLENPRSY